MKKILTHISNERTYFSFLQELSNHVNLISGSLHENIFDAYQKYNPDIVLLPIYEYTQEFHELINTFKHKTQFIIFCGEMVHNDLLKYCAENGIKTIRKNCSYKDKNILNYQYLYDNTVFKDLSMERNDKILTILSSNNEINHNLLDKILYPQTNLKLSLINNTNFSHVQNVGVANNIDMTILLNKYKSVIDLSGSYEIEINACNINSILVNDNLLYNIENNVLNEPIKNIDSYSIKNFIINQLLPFIGA